MSRIGKQPIPIPPKTEVSVENSVVKVKGPLGELSRAFLPVISIEVSNGEVLVNPKKKTLFTQALWGTTASHIKNMIQGVNVLYVKKLVIEGIGYKAEISGDSLVLHTGLSHPLKISIPKGIKVSAEKGIITISGNNKESVGQFAATVRAQKKPEPYKGKGIRYADEVIRRKQGKRAV
ncbi:MAG: 50S ribosomal protein L6 [Parcubacteria group bacterium]|nr:50S ribosomal protein L6 [Parcubacteria group bacterium]